MNMTYRFFVSPKGIPLQLSMLGINLYTGGHKDEYVATYTKYEVCAMNSISVIVSLIAVLMSPSYPIAIHAAGG
jgi:hypothetical protein